MSNYTFEEIKEKFYSLPDNKHKYSSYDILKKDRFGNRIPNNINFRDENGEFHSVPPKEFNELMRAEVEETELIKNHLNRYKYYIKEDGRDSYNLNYKYKVSEDEYGCVNYETITSEEYKELNNLVISKYYKDIKIIQNKIQSIENINTEIEKIEKNKKFLENNNKTLDNTNYGELVSNYMNEEIYNIEDDSTRNISFDDVINLTGMC